MHSIIRYSDHVLTVPKFLWDRNSIMYITIDTTSFDSAQIFVGSQLAHVNGTAQHGFDSAQIFVGSQ